jgi:hypothetical protein
MPTPPAEPCATCTLPHNLLRIHKTRRTTLAMATKSNSAGSNSSGNRGRCQPYVGWPTVTPLRL